MFIKPNNNSMDIISSLSSFYRKQNVYLVGGTIRDMLLGLRPKDFDLFVIGSGIELARNFSEKVGGSFILLDEDRDEARVVIGDYIFDFNGGIDIVTDLKRRDFTINSMAIKLPSSRIIDPFGGKRDLRRGIIRAMYEKNISDDPLRVIRAFRFKCIYDFSIDRRTRCWMSRYKDKLKGVAEERIKTELFYILNGTPCWQTLSDMAEMGVLDEIIPEFSSLKGVPQNKPYGDLVYHSINTVRALEELKIDMLPCPHIFLEYLERNKTVLKLACLLHDVGKPQTCEFKKDRVHFYGHEKVGVDIVKTRLRLSNEEKSIITTLIKQHMRPHLLASDHNYTRRAVVRLVSSSGEDTPGLLLLALSDAYASAGLLSNGLMQLVNDAVDVMTQKEQMKERLVTGDDLIALGLVPGPIFREILSMVEEEITLGNLETKDEAIIYIKKRWL
ncbi:CCA tRNA nucleotidyltransferase [candidate division WOR-3 bacterium]|nr:CCA tRNA nucleotidyltransferase [candidate division WOR-3 bacterium]